jgi:phage-related protein
MDVMRGLGSLVQNLFAGNTLNALGDLSLVITTVFTSIGQALGMGEADAQAFGMTVDGLVSQVLTVIQGVIGFVTTTVLPVLSWLATAAIGAFQQIWATVQTVWPQIQTIIATYLNGIWTVVQQVIGIVVQFWQINGSQIIATGQQIWSTVLGTVQAVLPQIQSIVQSVMGFITQFMTDHGAEIQMILQQAWFTISMAVGLAVQIVQATIVPAFQAVAGFLQTHSAEIQAVINTVWGVISQVIWTAMTVIQGVIQAISAAIQGDWTGFGLALRGIWDETIGRLVSAVQEIDWLATGKSIIEGLGNGMGAMAGWLSEAAVNVAKNALSAIKAFFGIKSPSTVMADQVGAPMAMGIGAGFSQALAGLQPAFAVDMQNVVTALRPAPAVAGSRNVTINLHLPAGTPVETQQAARRGAEEAWRAAAAEIGMQLE